MDVLILFKLEFVNKSETLNAFLKVFFEIYEVFVYYL